MVNLEIKVEWIVLQSSVLETILFLELKSGLILKCSELVIYYLSAFYRQGIVLGYYWRYALWKWIPFQ